MLSLKFNKKENNNESLHSELDKAFEVFFIKVREFFVENVKQFDRNFIFCILLFQRFRCFANTFLVEEKRAWLFSFKEKKVTLKKCMYDLI